jgi:hypothetical protein
MKAGWRTWTEKEWLRYTDDGFLILETNYYKMNFPKEHFVIIED